MGAQRIEGDWCHASVYADDYRVVLAAHGAAGTAYLRLTPHQAAELASALLRAATEIQPINAIQAAEPQGATTS